MRDEPPRRSRAPVPPNSDDRRIGVAISDDRAKAGNLLFEITGAPSFVIDEILLVPLSAVAAPIPDLGRLLGKAGLGPGESLSVSVELLPGEYALVVNSLGSPTELLWAALTVTG